jgi:hypothetical protein
VRHGERGDGERQRSERATDENEPEQEQQMIVPGQDVLDTHAQERHEIGRLLRPVPLVGLGGSRRLERPYQGGRFGGRHELFEIFARSKLREVAM